MHITYQPPLRPHLPDVSGCKDYREERAFYERLDEVLQKARLDEWFTRKSVEAHPHRAQSERFLLHSRSAFRCMLVKQLGHY